LLCSFCNLFFIKEGEDVPLTHFSEYSLKNKTSDLFVDAIYEGGSKVNISDDPIKEIFPVGNAGGGQTGQRKHKQ
jgi:hypothetical protein